MIERYIVSVFHFIDTKILFRIALQSRQSWSHNVWIFKTETWRKVQMCLDLTRVWWMAAVCVRTKAQHEEDRRWIRAGDGCCQSRIVQNRSQCSHALITYPILSIITVQPTALLISIATATDWYRDAVYIKLSSVTYVSICLTSLPVCLLLQDDIIHHPVDIISHSFVDCGWYL